MRWLPAVGALFASLALAEAPATPTTSATPGALQFVSAHAIEGMRGGNLSGLAGCGDALWAVSDRDDDFLYRLQPDETAGSTWQAAPEFFAVPGAPESGLPWGVRMRAWSSAFFRGGAMDYEGIACDKAGNRYLASEAYAAVLRLPLVGEPEWLALPPNMLREAHASGLLMKFNATYEGLAVDPDGKRLWLAAERQRRGLLLVRRSNSAWKCAGDCVLLSEGGTALSPVEPESQRKWAVDFSDLAFYRDKLFTLERLTHQVCRRDAATGAREQCWSIAAGVLAPARNYALPPGVAEALVIDDKGAWIGLDNGNKPRGDGDVRPYVLRFAAPAGGWLGGK